MVDTDRQYLVVKANELIRKRHNLSLQEAKIVIYLISKIKPDDDDFKYYKFSISEFCKICGIEVANYTYIKNTVQKLRDKSWWMELEDGEETTVSWIVKPKIHQKNGTIRIRLDEDLKPFLLNLKKHFTQYNLYYTLPMKSQYSVRLYEILKSYEYQGEWLVDVENFKKILNCENYTRWADLRRKVIEIAIKEINEFTDIEIEYDPIKDGRSFKEIEFTIRTRKGIQQRLEQWINIEDKLKKA